MAVSVPSPGGASRPSPELPSAARDRLRRLLRRRWAKVLLAAQVVAAVVLLCRELGWLQPAELAAYDRLVVAWAGADASERILLVTVREADVGRPDWPFSDERLHLLLERLIASGARAVGVDIYRDHPRPPGEQALADLLSRHPEIVWVFKLPDEGGEGIPAPLVLAGSRRAVLADVVTDAGGVVRRGLLAATDPGTGRTVRALGVSLAEMYTGQRLRGAGDGGVALGDGRVVLLDERFGPYAHADTGGYQTLLDFHGGPRRFPRLSVAEAMEGDAAAPLVRGRVVLVGTEAPSVKDSFASPFSTGWGGGEPLAGVAVHAHLADQLIRIHAGEAASRTALPWAADAAIVWACATAAAAAGLAFPSAGLAFAAVLAAGLGLIAGAAHAAFGAAGVILPGVPAVLAWIGAAAGAVWVLHGAGARERLRLRRSFEHYLDPRIIKGMLDAEALPSFGGERREVTALFTDVAGFTALSETMPAEQVAALLRDYFDGVCAAVLACGGLVSVFLGDGLLALFGAPQRQDDHPDRAVEAALRIDAFAHRFAAEQRAAGVEFGGTRIGVHTGVALVGNVGTRARLNYGAIGDVVNTASRLEGLNKRIGTRIAVSGETAARCARHRFRPVGEFVLHGRRAALPVSTPLTPAEAADRERVERYEAAYAALRAGDAGATAQFLALQHDAPGDPCVAFHCARLAAGRTGISLVMEEK